VDERGHYERFKRLHKEGMALAQIERARPTSTNGSKNAHKMQDVLHLPDALPAGLRWRDHVRAWWHRLEKEWEPVRVNKQIDSVTMPKWIASAILVAILGVGATSWWRLSDQRDMLIELKTEIRIEKEFEAERSKEAKAQADLQKVYIDNMTNQLNVIKGLLTAQQLNAVESTRKGTN
jgi:hypothetical protein